jgi:hypothetical protein
VLGNGYPEPLHAATHVHHDHHILGRGSGLDVPGAQRQGQAMDGKPEPGQPPEQSLPYFYSDLCSSASDVQIDATWARLHPFPQALDTNEAIWGGSNWECVHLMGWWSPG